MDEKNNAFFRFNINKTYYSMRIWHHWIIFLIGTIVPLIVAYPIQYILLAFDISQETVILTSNLISNGSVIIASILFLSFCCKGYFTYLFKEQIKIIKILVYMISCFLVMNLLNFIWQVAATAIAKSAGILITDNANQSTIQVLMNFSKIGVFFLTVVLAPISEELTYRLGLSDGIFRSKPWVGILVSSLIFGLIHFNFDVCYSAMLDSKYLPELYNELLNIPSYIISGFMLGLAYKLSGSLLTSWGLHTLNNLIAFIFMAFDSNLEASNSILQIFIR